MATYPDQTNTLPPATMFMTPIQAPLSGEGKRKSRISMSETYDKASPEWYIKLTPTLPKIWIRDIGHVTPEMGATWDRDWRRYTTLCIPGKGDGAGLDGRTRHGRRKLKAEYKKLNPKVRAAKEIALARYAPFCMCADGTLDYHVGANDGYSCVVM